MHEKMLRSSLEGQMLATPALLLLTNLPFSGVGLGRAGAGHRLLLPAAGPVAERRAWAVASGKVVPIIACCA